MESLAGAGSLTGAQKEELIETVKQQIALANAQELLTVRSACDDVLTEPQLTHDKMTEKCFKKCVGKPGTSLESSEQKCVAMCMDRYMDCWNLVSKAYGHRIQREQNRN